MSSLKSDNETTSQPPSAVLVKEEEKKEEGIAVNDQEKLDQELEEVSPSQTN